MIIKCKMCGGDIDFIPGATYGTCEYCGSTSTIPQADDEGKLNRYNRANHFRRQCEFDKAVSAYEKLLEQDDTDAEAHWGAVISRYGIEYVEDPATKKRIPTCHRVQVASILADADYLAAVENAPDATSRDLYKQQAAEIAEIQKGILAISANEKPYDVFICYKETDEQGQRTRDSQWAQDVYYGLTEQGYKVFFSRITLEDKLGQQYEPYIFAALNSAKVMVVIGSKPEYFNAVWVKNEWSRYLALMAKDRKRLLIPCYRGMDPYDLPEELSSLQSQDMSKIGFMQDLLRGIKKVLDADKKAKQPKVVQQVVQAVTPATDASPTITNLLKRVALFLEDGDFKQANEYLDRVLDLDVECAPAYAAKVCVALGLRREAALADTTFQYEDNADWQKALRFANAQQKATYEAYAAKVKDRVTVQIRNFAYDCAVEMAVNASADRSKLDSELASYKTSCTRSNGNRANGNRRQNSQPNENAFKQAVRTNEPGDVSEQGLKSAAAMFDAIKDSDAAECAKQCRALAEQARQKLIYNNAVIAHGNSRNNPTGLEQVAKTFLSVPQYKDAKVQAQKCVDEAESIRDSRYSYAVAAMKEAGDFSSNWEKAKNELADSELTNYRDVTQLRAQAAKRYDECLAAEKEVQRQKQDKARRKAEAEAKKRRHNKNLKIFMAILALIAVGISCYVVMVYLPEQKYKEAMNLRSTEQYTDSAKIFIDLEKFDEAANSYILEIQMMMQNKKWSSALMVADTILQLPVSVEQSKEAIYLKGKCYLEQGKLQDAFVAYNSIFQYKDALAQCRNIAQTYLNQGDRIAAATVYLRIGDRETARTIFDFDSHIRAGDLFTAAITIDGKLYITGDKSYQLENVDHFSNSSSWWDPDTDDSVVAVANNGSIVFGGHYSMPSEMRDSITKTKGLIEIHTGSVYSGSGSKFYTFCAALRQDGKVDMYYDCNKDLFPEVKTWKDVKCIQLVGYPDSIIAISHGGQVYCSGKGIPSAIARWTNIDKVIYRGGRIYGLKKDGTFTVYQESSTINKTPTDKFTEMLNAEKQIVDMIVYNEYIALLHQDRSVSLYKVESSSVSQISLPEEWNDVVAIEDGAYGLFGITSTGSVKYKSLDKYSHFEINDYVSTWSDIVAIDTYSDAGGRYGHVVGVSSTGKVFASGDGRYWDYSNKDGKMGNDDDYIRRDYGTYHKVGNWKLW